MQFCFFSLLVNFKLIPTFLNTVMFFQNRYVKSKTVQLPVLRLSSTKDGIINMQDYMEDVRLAYGKKFS